MDKVTEAFKEYLNEKNVALFEKYNVMNRNEITARFEIKEETYLKKIQIESRVLADIAINHIIPTAMNYQNVLIDKISRIAIIFIAKSILCFETERKKAQFEHRRS